MKKGSSVGMQEGLRYKCRFQERNAGQLRLEEWMQVRRGLKEVIYGSVGLKERMQVSIGRNVGSEGSVGLQEGRNEGQVKCSVGFQDECLCRKE